MAIERCPNGHVYDRDWNTECPRCPVDAMAKRHAANVDKLMAARAPVAVQISTPDDEPKALIRILRDETNNRDVFERCKRVLGEA